jgi:hypothetical protein
VTCPFRRLPSLRLRRVRGRLLCRLILPLGRTVPDSCVREVVVVAGPRSPRLRRLTVHRCRTGGHEDPPRAA